jgi:hypothetical protein
VTGAGITPGCGADGLFENFEGTLDPTLNETYKVVGDLLHELSDIFQDEPLMSV